MHLDLLSRQSWQKQITVKKNITLHCVLFVVWGSKYCFFWQLLIIFLFYILSYIKLALNSTSYSSNKDAKIHFDNVLTWFRIRRFESEIQCNVSFHVRRIKECLIVAKYVFTFWSLLIMYKTTFVSFRIFGCGLVGENSYFLR